MMKEMGLLDHSEIVLLCCLAAYGKADLEILKSAMYSFDSDLLFSTIDDTIKHPPEGYVEVKDGIMHFTIMGCNEFNEGMHKMIHYYRNKK